jgi:hypothetical protein
MLRLTVFLCRLSHGLWWRLVGDWFENTVNRSITVSYEATHDAPHPPNTNVTSTKREPATLAPTTTTHPRTSPCGEHRSHSTMKTNQAIRSGVRNQSPGRRASIEQTTNNHERYWLYRTASRAHHPRHLHSPLTSRTSSRRDGRMYETATKQYNTTKLIIITIIQHSYDIEAEVEAERSTFIHSNTINKQPVNTT